MLCFVFRFFFSIIFLDVSASNPDIFKKNLSKNLTFKNTSAKEVNLEEEFEDGVTLSEIKIYEEVLKKLWEKPDVEEDVILEEISPSYNMNLDEMKSFLRRVRMPAIKFSNAAENTFAPTDAELLKATAKHIKKITKKKVKVPKKKESWEIQKTGNNYLIKTSDLYYNGRSHDLIIKLESDTFYQTFTIFQMKVDGQNIDF